MALKKKKDIGTAIGKLRGTSLLLQQSQSINIDMLLEAIENTQELFSTMDVMLSLSIVKPERSALIDFIDSMAYVVNNLYSVAQLKQHPPSSPLLEQVTSSLNTFMNKIITKNNRIKVRKALGYVGIAESVLFYCGNIPYFWHNATPTEKVTLILGAVLVVTSVALTVAAFANPAVGSAVGGGFGIMLIAALGIFMYRLVLENLRPKHNEQKKIKKALEDVEKQKVALDDFITRNIPDYVPKENLVYSAVELANAKEANAEPETQQKSKLKSPKIKPNNSGDDKEKID